MPMSGFLAKGHLLRLLRQSRLSANDKVIMRSYRGLCTDLLEFALRLSKTQENFSLETFLGRLCDHSSPGREKKGKGGEGSVSIERTWTNSQFTCYTWNKERNCASNKREVRQGCCIFKLYGEYLMKETLAEVGNFKFGGRIINRVRFADDTAIIAIKRLFITRK